MIAAPGDVRPKIGVERHLFALKPQTGTHSAVKTATLRTNFHQKPAQSRVSVQNHVPHGGAVVRTTGQPATTAQAATTAEDQPQGRPATRQEVRWP